VNKRPIFIGAGVLLLAVIVFASIRGNEPKGEKVYVEPARPQKIEAVVTAPGEVQPKFKVNISAAVIAKIEHLYFNEGDLVKKGEKLVELERPAYVAQRDRMRAELANRRIEVTRAQAALGTAELAYKRAVNMQRQGIQAQELFDKARLDYENAKAAYASSAEGVRQAAAGLQQADNDLSHTTLLSPIDGKVVQLNAREGEVVVTGTMNNPGSVIAVIADLSQILVEAEVGETEVVGIRVGQAGKIHVDAVPEKEYAGRVIEIDHRPPGRTDSIVTLRTGAGDRRVVVSDLHPDQRLILDALENALLSTRDISVGVLATPSGDVVERFVLGGAASS